MSTASAPSDEDLSAVLSPAFLEFRAELLPPAGTPSGPPGCLEVRVDYATPYSDAWMREVGDAAEHCLHGGSPVVFIAPDPHLAELIQFAVLGLLELRRQGWASGAGGTA